MLSFQIWRVVNLCTSTKNGLPQQNHTVEKYESVAPRKRVKHSMDADENTKNTHSVNGEFRRIIIILIEIKKQREEKICIITNERTLN